MPRPATLTACRLEATVLLLCLGACQGSGREDVLTFSGSAVGREGEVVRAQLARFGAARGIEVEIRSTPDSADPRHQLYVPGLNARSADPDVLQLDVVWTPEFAAAGWLAPLDRFAPDTGGFFPSAVAANRWRGALFGLPWFVDVGMLYWRTDLLERAPRSFEELAEAARAGRRAPGVRYGFVWQGARYEGLITVFVEHLGGFGGSILDQEGAVVVDSEAAVRALEWMRDAIHERGVTPTAVLTWHEEETRFAFQNGAAVLMRNWPYARALLAAPDSPVAGRFAVAPMPAVPGRGVPTAALGGSQLALNARSRQPEDAFALIEFLTAPEQMLERAREVGQLPSRTPLYAEGGGLERVLGIAPAEALAIVAAARPRPVTPVYTQLSEILQIHLHRALTGQAEPPAALAAAAGEMRALLERAGLAPGASS